MCFFPGKSSSSPRLNKRRVGYFHEKIAKRTTLLASTRWHRSHTAALSVSFMIELFEGSFDIFGSLATYKPRPYSCGESPINFIKIISKINFWVTLYFLYGCSYVRANVLDVIGGVRLKLIQFSSSLLCLVI